MRLLVKTTILLAFVILLAKCSGQLEEVVLSPVRMAQGLGANVEMRNLQYALQLHRVANERYLPEREFEAWVARSFRGQFKDPLLDSWGERYRYELFRGGFRLRSAGPDRRRGTPDDIVLIWKEKRR